MVYVQKTYDVYAKNIRFRVHLNPKAFNLNPKVYMPKTYVVYAKNKWSCQHAAASMLAAAGWQLHAGRC